MIGGGFANLVIALWQVAIVGAAVRREVVHHRQKAVRPVVCSSFDHRVVIGARSDALAAPVRDLELPT